MKKKKKVLSLLKKNVINFLNYSEKEKKKRN